MIQLKQLLFVACLSSSFLLTFSQTGLKKGASVQNLAIHKALNSAPGTISSFSDLQGKLIILDFFGTWCLPCIKALPHLSEIQARFKDDVKVVLISNEKEAQLQKFLKAKNNVTFPVIVDEDNNWNSTFQPPSLPYTAVIKDGKVLEITTAENITEQNIRNWISTPVAAVAVPEAKQQSKAATGSPNRKTSNPLIRLTEEFIYAAKVGEPVNELKMRLDSLSFDTLASSLATDSLKKAFWINLYNGFTQAALKENPDQYKKRSTFFKRKNIRVGGQLFSLDNIEHGILRRSKVKWSLGHFSKLFPGKSEKRLRVNQLDPRIHFALNCGAKSCPPIAFYSSDILDKQLDLATQAYLSSEVVYNADENQILLPKLMSWFRADFGGKKGMIRLVKELKLIPQSANPKIKFADYDWQLTLNNYKNL